MSFTPIDLSKLPSPDVVEQIDYKTIYAAMINDLRSRDAVFSALVESDPACKILEVAAYREMLLRQRVNDAARGVMLAFAHGSDLEHLGAFYGVSRKTLRPADLEAIPLTDAIMEEDADLRFRITLALEGLSTAGPEGSYLFHLLKSPNIKDASVVGPPLVEPGQVLVTLLGNSGDGTVTETIINEIKSLLNAEDVRPITDEVIVKSAKIHNYKIIATLYTFDGPDPNIITAKAQKNAEAFVSAYHRVARDIPLSGIYGALHVDGIQRVDLKEPQQNIIIDHTAAAYCTDIKLTYGGVDQ